MSCMHRVVDELAAEVRLCAIDPLESTTGLYSTPIRSNRQECPAARVISSRSYVYRNNKVPVVTPALPKRDTSGPMPGHIGAHPHPQRQHSGAVSRRLSCFRRCVCTYGAVAARRHCHAAA